MQRAGAEPGAKFLLGYPVRRFIAVEAYHPRPRFGFYVRAIRTVAPA